MKTLIPAGIIATIFFFIWVVQYPTELKEAMFFQGMENKTDIFASIFIWVFFLLMINLIVFVAK